MIGIAFTLARIAGFFFRREQAKAYYGDTSMKVSNLLRWVTAFEVSVLIVAGAGLFLFPSFFTQHWAWDLLPFNTRFLGGIYLASMLSAAAIVIYPYWSTGRIVVPMIIIFTSIVLVVSIVYFERFTGPIYAIVLWFILYIVIPINGIAHLWMYREQKPDSDIILPTIMRYWLWIQSLILGIYGIALILIPQTASAFWTWTLDDFHARLYSVAFITPALGAFLLARFSSSKGLIILGITQLAGGLLPIIGTVIVNNTINRIDWLKGDSLLWTGLFAYITLSGLMMLIVAFRISTKET